MTAMYTDHNGRQYPVADTYLDIKTKPGDLLLICPLCGRGHVHGTDAKEGQRIAGLLLMGQTFFEGHRAPHCGEREVGEGYVLNVVGFVTPAFEKEWRRTRRRAYC